MTSRALTSLIIVQPKMYSWARSAGYPIGGLADDDAQLGFVLRLFGQHAVHNRPAYTKRRGAIVLAGSPHELICSGATG
jgi:hypothetical protein